jgi:hypothetical protein
LGIKEDETARGRRRAPVRHYSARGRTGRMYGRCLWERRQKWRQKMATSGAVFGILSTAPQLKRLAALAFLFKHSVKRPAVLGFHRRLLLTFFDIHFLPPLSTVRGRGRGDLRRRRPSHRPPSELGRLFSFKPKSDLKSWRRHHCNPHLIFPARTGPFPLLAECRELAVHTRTFFAVADSRLYLDSLLFPDTVKDLFRLLSYRQD